jgi:hypothetical protein
LASKGWAFCAMALLPAAGSLEGGSLQETMVCKISKYTLLCYKLTLKLTNSAIGNPPKNGDLDHRE